MGFRINRGIFQYQDGEEFRNKFKIAEDGRMVEVDAEGNPTTAFLKVGDTATDADTVDGIDSGSFLRSDAANSFTSTITMNTQQAFKPANFGQGVYGRYDSTRYQHLWGMGQSWHMAENGTNLGNFYGLAYTHTNVGGESKSGLSHQTLFVENGVTKTAIGRGVWTDGNITATGDANISGNLDIGGAVVGSSSGVALAVGGASTHGVYTADNARNQLVVSANYYPHFVIAADLSNNSNHGAVISLVGSDSDGTSKSWGIGISNRNPHLFSIGYNKNSDPNPHYGVGDGWSGDDDNHARLSIDRSGNTKIRGSLYVNGTSGGITTGSKVATEAYASGAAETVNLRIEEEILPAIDTKLDAGATAVNASKSSLIQTISSTREGDDAMPSLGYSLQHFLAKGPSNNDGHILGMTWTGTSVYGAQIWVDTDPNNKMAFRSRSNAGVWTRWNNLWHDGNLTNVSQLSNDSGYINGEGIARFNKGTIDASSSVFTHMRGATSLNNPSGTGGAIKIALPPDASFTNTMMFMTIKVYEYSTSKSFTLYCGGYNYYTQSWYNTFAYIVGAETRGDIPVKFGHDGERNIIWIGNPDWSWGYPNVFISEFNSGHTQNSNWNDGWDISFDQEPAINVSGSHIAYRNITQGNISSQHVERARDLGAYYTADDWIRATSDDNTVKFYGNTRMMVFRTDGEGGDTGHTGYAFKWTYGGDGTGATRMLLDNNGNLWTSSYGWLHSRFETAGASAIVNDRIETEIIPSITSAQSAANDAQAAADLAVATADAAEARANSAREDAAAAQSTADSKLGATAKAADSNLLDGYDHTAFWKNNEERIAKVIRFTGEGGDSGNSSYNYAIYQEGGAWSSPFPDLVIAMHTGIKIGGYWNYGGTRFYNDSPGRSGASEIFSVGNGDSNVRVTNNLHIGSAGGWITDLLNAKATTGDVAGVDARINDEVLPQVTANATNIARNATDIATKLGTTGKAADSEAVDGVDSSRIVYGANARRSTRYDQAGIVSPNQNSGFYYGYNPDGAPFDEWWNWVAIAGASWTSSNNYDFKLAHSFHGDDFYVSRMTNGSQQSWRRIIDSGNIGSQTVANAGYATNAGNADAIDGVSFRNTGSNEGVNANTIASNGITYYNSNVPNFTGNATDGALYSQAYSSSWQHQIAGDYRSGQLAVRGKNNGTWQPWRTILDSSNFTSFVPAAAAPVQAVVEGGNDSTLVSIFFSPGEGAATFTLADGQTFRLAFAR